MIINFLVRPAYYFEVEMHLFQDLIELVETGMDLGGIGLTDFVFKQTRISMKLARVFVELLDNYTDWMKDNECNVRFNDFRSSNGNLHNLETVLIEMKLKIAIGLRCLRIEGHN